MVVILIVGEHIQSGADAARRRMAAAPNKAPSKQ